MKCFQIFSKDKKLNSRSSPGKSAPELSSSRRRENEPNRAAKSTGSMPFSRRTIPEMYREREHNLRVFSVQELREATNNFNRLLKIGEGGFGSVYKGSIKPAPNADPTIVAIKKLNTHGLQGHKQWVAEVQFLGVLDHPNLVKLLGYCSLDGERGIQRLLVYEYMPNKSLEDHLFNRAMPTIPWVTRLNIILGAAQGMAYLHEGLEVQVIYRDFKSSNVLLDKDFNPRLSDFGLAREGPAGDRTHVSTAPVGTRGYAAPEYVETGHLTVKSDIWSFGVVLYEVLTGRRTLERNLPLTERKLLEWVRQFPADSNRFSMIVDPRLQNQYSLNAARRIAKLADICLNKNPKDRPSMTQVVGFLKQAMEESEGTRSQSLTTHPNKPFGRMEAATTSRQMPHMAQRLCPISGKLSYGKDSFVDGAVIAAARTMPTWSEGDTPPIPSVERKAVKELQEECHQMLAEFSTTMSQDQQILESMPEARRTHEAAIKYRLHRKLFIEKVIQALDIYQERLLF